ncbi:MAG: DnaA ATPase domain-containing protein, partial [bacterium]
DIHFLSKREQTQEEFFHTFNSLYQTSRQIVLSSDAAPNEIPDLEERLVSRFNCGLVARMDRPCYETRVSILKTKAEMHGMDIPDDVPAYIAAKVDTNIRELEGALTCVRGY